MKRFRKYLGKTFEISMATEERQLERFGIKIRYAPEEPEDFDEFEFGLDYKDEQDVAFLVAIEKGKVARLLFGWTVKENPDMMKPMDDRDLEGLLNQCGNNLIEFFEFVTT